MGIKIAYFSGVCNNSSQITLNKSTVFKFSKGDAKKLVD
jgi:hypothetical protein